MVMRTLLWCLPLLLFVLPGCNRFDDEPELLPGNGQEAPVEHAPSRCASP
jgi:hypothetical protein